MQYETFHLREWPEVPPSKCMICGANHRRDGRKYIDFGQNIPRYGAVYICTVCMGEAVSKLLGYLHPADAQHLTEKSKKIEDDYFDLRNENDRLRSALAQLDFLGSIRDDGAISTSGTDEGESDTTDNDNESIESVERRETSEDRSNESSDERGSTNLHGVALPDISNAF